MKTNFDISKFHPCLSGMEYYNQFTDYKEAWNKCPRGDWMLWIAERLGVDSKKLMVTADCFKPVMKELFRRCEHESCLNNDAVKQAKLETANICREILTESVFQIIESK